MNKSEINQMQKKNRDLLIANTALSWSFIVFGIIFLLLFLYLVPFPERYSINEMDDYMIEQGEARNLIILYFMGTIMLLCFLASLASNIDILSFYFVKNNYELKQYSQQKTKGWLVLQYFLETIFILFYLILSSFMVLYFWLLYIKEYEYKLKNTNLLFVKNNVSFCKKSKRWFFASTLTAIPVVAATIGITYLTIPHKYKATVSSENVTKSLTFSKNQPNIFVLYFDRVQSFLWNSLLYMDYELNQQNSFIEMFPEFRSYTQTLSLSNLTRLSTPSMYAGYEYAPWISSYTDSQLTYNWTQNQIVFDSLKRLSQMLIHNNYKNITYNNVPYYGKKFDTCGEMNHLYEDFQKQHLDINTCTNYDIAYSGMNYHSRNVQSKKICEQYVLDHLPSHLKFEETNHNVFNWSFFQNCHIEYNIKENNRYTCKIDSEYFIPSMWQTIQSLKVILNKFKTEGIYDNTMFLIVSDHGFQLTDYFKTYRSVIDYLVSHHIIDETLNTQIASYRQFGFNPIFMVKKFHQQQTPTIHPKNPHNFFQNKQLITMADIPYVLEHEIDCSNHKETTFQSSHFISHHLHNQQDQITQFIRNQISLSPLDNFATNRQFILSLTRDWRYYPNIVSWKIYKNIFYKLNNETYLNNANFTTLDN